MKIIRQKCLAAITYLAFTLITHPVTADENLAQLINERLSHMKSVAAYKWLRKLPIEDLEREATVIESAKRSGLDHGITTHSSEVFFQAQITAAKEIQSYWYQQWATGQGPTNAPDLVKEVRPALITLGNAITAKLSREKVAADQISMQGLSSDTAAAIASAVNNVEKYHTPLDQVTKSGVLRVGTTWDYAPFSTKRDNQPTGIDIDLAQDLAESLGAEVVFVTTSWPTLMKDFEAGKFDIGMSGISINLQRARTAFFSNAYHSGGKTPIVRCRDITRFDSLDKIDSATTRLIVNPGGTNQRFVNNRIKHASVALHDDNRTIFRELIAGRADVMITDEIEVRLQSNINDELCAAMPDQTLTFQEKGYLLPQNQTWKNYVDTWLKQRTGDGTLAASFERHRAN